MTMTMASDSTMPAAAVPSASSGGAGPIAVAAWPRASRVWVALVRAHARLVRTLLDALRAVELCLVFSPCVATLPLWLLERRWRGDADRSDEDRDWWLRLMVRCLERAGPTFVKLGQWASTRADLFSAGLRRELGVLHTNCGLEPAADTARTLKDALVGAGAGQHLELEELDLTQRPLGAGCIAQVLRGTLAGSGRPVAVKVQRRHVRGVVERDVSLLHAAVWLTTAVLPASLVRVLALDEAAALFGDFMLQQMDFHQEAANLLRFQRNFADSDLPVRFASPLFVSPCGQVLVESLEEGEPLSALLERARGGRKGECLGECLGAARGHRIGTVGVQAFLKMVLLDNFCHSDLHPGNIIVRMDKLPEGENPETATEIRGEVEAPFDDKELRAKAEAEAAANPNAPEASEAASGLSLSFIDAGLTTELREEDQANFVDLFAAVACGNGRLAGELMVERADPSKLARCDAASLEAFVSGIDGVVSTVKVASFRLDRVNVGGVLEQVLSLVRKHQVPIDPAFTNLILSIIVLEGLGKQLDPTLDIFKEALPVLARSPHMTHLLRATLRAKLRQASGARALSL